MFRFWYHRPGPHRFARGVFSLEGSRIEDIKQWRCEQDELPNEIYETIVKFRSAYVSVNSFPNGHPKECGSGVIVPARHLYIDSDMDGSAWMNRSKKMRRTGIYQRFMDGLIGVGPVRKYRDEHLMESIRNAQAWASELQSRRWSVALVLLSGFKGAHLYMSFQTLYLPSELYTPMYASFFESLSEESGLKVDTRVKDLGTRVLRVPNTVNMKASIILGKPVFSVPVTVEELMSIDSVERYDELCSFPRIIEYEDKISPGLAQAFIHHKPAAEEEVKTDTKSSDMYIRRRTDPIYVQARQEWAKDARTAKRDELLSNLRPCIIGVIPYTYTDWDTRTFMANDLVNVVLPSGERPSLDSVTKICFSGFKDFKIDTTKGFLQYAMARKYRPWSCHSVRKNLGDDVCLPDCPFRDLTRRKNGDDYFIIADFVRFVTQNSPEPIMVAWSEIIGYDEYGEEVRERNYIFNFSRDDFHAFCKFCEEREVYEKSVHRD